MSEDRKGFEEAVANISIASSQYFNEYVFYMHLIAQCRLILDPSMEAPAAVNFDKNTYNLYINPKTYNDFPLEQRIGILKHEMLHIVLGHLFRYDKNETNFTNFNYATDCALNQEIEREHLPKGAIYPDNFPAPEANDDWNQTAEFYYNLLESSDDPSKNPGMSSGSGGEGEGEGDSSKGGEIDDHSMWKEGVCDQYIQEEITKNMLEKAADNTIKSRGNLPSNYSAMLDNIMRSREVDWKKVVRNIVGNKKANVRKTLMRKDRRMPGANWIKGRTKDRIFELAVISDVSGSVGDEALLKLWGSIIDICHMFNTPVKVVQVDTEPKPPEELTKTTKTIERQANGGTFLSPALETLKEYKISYNALVITTDGYLCKSDVEPFSKLKVPVIWLIESNGQIMPEMTTGTMQAIKLKK
jgi:predicted metal-dependent peptidase